MLTVSRSTTLGAINRKESRGGHTRDDYPKPVPELGAVNFVQRIPADERGPGGAGGTPSIRCITVDPEPILVMPDDLKELFEEAT
jgi:succinate dehydrogenase / fumarate reductase flavoprotein subunit